ncbi:MAG TPA: hypothetical protein VMV94_08270, partial [Phycisphaerae bacterium]|nr:hypothetical protein [Phycisphaerae bacterium]
MKSSTGLWPSFVVSVSVDMPHHPRIGSLSDAAADDAERDAGQRLAGATRRPVHQSSERENPEQAPKALPERVF